MHKVSGKILLLFLWTKSRIFVKNGVACTSLRTLQQSHQTSH